MKKLRCLNPSILRIFNSEIHDEEVEFKDGISTKPLPDDVADAFSKEYDDLTPVQPKKKSSKKKGD